MPRDIPVGNGDLLLSFDRVYRVRDLYFPNVGRLNHTDGSPQKFGVWADGRFAWIEDPEWTRRMGYLPDTLVTDVRLVHHGLGLEITCHDAVDHTEPVYFRRCLVRDLLGRPRDVRLFFHFDLSIRGTAVGDTANYDPATNSVIIYKDDSYFLVCARDEHKLGIDHWAIGTKRLGGAEGTWRDAEDGVLGKNAISQGSVDATVGLHVPVRAHEQGAATLWAVCGPSYQAVKQLNKRVVEVGPERMIGRTEAYWRLWCRRDSVDTGPLPSAIRQLFMRSQLVMRTQIDNRGAIVAANDSDVTAFGGDHYSYCWMRDGALVAHALTLSNHGEVARRFFDFAARAIERDGYFLHKYTPLGQLASSWHPWIIEGQRVLPIQEDETALVVWSLRRHFEAFREVEFVKPLYESLVVRPAEWMISYQDENGLPLPSWDLWEERRGIHTFTVASVIGALRAAAAFAQDFGEPDRAARYAEHADRMKRAMKKYLWVGEKKQFARMATPMAGGGYRLDMTRDSANFALFAFGAFHARDPMVEAEMASIRERLWIKTDVGGCARYEHDYFHQVERERIAEIPGNPWIICTLWHAQHRIARAANIAELREALEYLEWTAGRALESGVLAEQFHPYTGQPLGVSPLTWSHATLVQVVIEYLRKHQELTRGTARGPGGAEVETEMSSLA
ncbi:MAG: glycoside hydrolase family 15 protein [Phycisphaerales bacterium]